MAYTVSVDPNVCQGYACCVMTASTVFDLDEEVGKAVVIQASPGEDMRDLVEKAARGCPAHAITLQET